MQLCQRLAALVEELAKGNVSAFCRNISINNVTFSGYLDDKGQQKVRLSLLLEILEAYPQVNRDWLVFGEGDMFADGSRMGMRMGARLAAASDEDVARARNAAVHGVDGPAPIAGRLVALEQAMGQADDLAKVEAMIALLKGEHQMMFKKRGGYGDGLAAREPGTAMAHEDTADYPADESK